MSDPELHVEHSGTGPALVLAHGFGGSSRNFRPQARYFAARRTTWLYDARGHARSGAPPSPQQYDEAQLVGDFARVVQAAGDPSAVVGGLSLGAYTALRYALSASQPPRGLILAAFPSPGSAARERWALGFADAISEHGLDVAGAEFVWAEASRFDPKAAALIRQGFLEHTPHALAAILRNVLATLPAPSQLADELRAFECPVLVVVGSEDRESLAPSEELALLLPRVRRVVVPGAGHVVNLADPARFNQAVAEFLEQDVGAAPG